MSSPTRFIPLAVALDLIHSAVAVQIDGSYVTYPTDPGDEDEFCLVCAASTDMDEEDTDRFRTADNADVEVTSGGFVFVDSRKERVTVLPLIAASLV